MQKQGQSFFDKVGGKLKDIGLLVDDPKTIKTAPATPQVAPTPTQFAYAPTSASSAAPTAAEDPFFVTQLEGALSSKALQNTYDYFKFKKAVETFVSRTKCSEAQAIASALISAETAGSTKDKVIDTAQGYIAVLDTEQRQFEQDIMEHNKDEIQAIESKVTQLQASIDADTAEIKRLQDQVTETSNKKSAASTELSSAKQRVETKKNSFMATYNRLKTNITNDIAKLREA